MDRAAYKDFTQRDLVCSFLSEIGPDRFIATTTHYENDQQHVIVYYWKLPEHNPSIADNVEQGVQDVIDGKITTLQDGQPLQLKT